MESPKPGENFRRQCVVNLTAIATRERDGLIAGGESGHEFNKVVYDAGLRDAIRVLIDEFAMRYPGIKRVEHEYFYAVHGAESAQWAGYLERAYTLGREF